MIIIGNDGSFTPPSMADIIVVIDRSGSVSAALDSQVEKCVDKLIDNLGTNQMKIFGGVQSGGNVGFGGFTFDPWEDDNTNGGPEGFDNTVSELKEAVDYILANTGGDANRDEDWVFYPVDYVASQQTPSDPLEWSEPVKEFGNRFLIYITDGEGFISDGLTETIIAGEYEDSYISPIIVDIGATPIDTYWSDLIDTGNWSSVQGQYFAFSSSENDFTSLVTWITGL